MAEPPRASILVTGDEVLNGRITDTNAGPLGMALQAHGLHLVRTVVVGDDDAGIAAEIERSLSEGLDLVVTTGGLGPTADDLTMAAVARAAGVELVQNADARRAVQERTAWVDLDPDVRARLLDAQALLPEGAALIPAAGTAPGAALEVADTLIVVLPGPPWERAQMWDWAAARPPLSPTLARGRAAPRRVLRIFGVSESRFVQELDRLEPAVTSPVDIGVCARDGELEVTVAGTEPALDALAAALSDAHGDQLYSSDGTDLDTTVQDALRSADQTVAVAESCTGGGLGARITSTPGASDIFVGGVISYSNHAKRSLLGVPAAMLERHGAVSAETAALMADGVRETLGADWGLAITGVAGPGGGTREKPVGLVYLACAGPDRATTVQEHRFRGDRERIRDRSGALALHLLREALAAN